MQSNTRILCFSVNSLNSFRAQGPFRNYLAVRSIFSCSDPEPLLSNSKKWERYGQYSAHTPQDISCVRILDRNYHSQPYWCSQRHLSRKNNRFSPGATEDEGQSDKTKHRTRISLVNTRRQESFRKFRQNLRFVSRKSKAKVTQFVENIYTIPNALTCCRIILSPIIGGLVLTDHYSIALGLFCFAGITDFFDGMIARKYPSQQTVLGSVLDPLADKLLVSILYLSLTVQGLIPVALTGLVLSRDLALVIAAFYVRFVSLPPPRTFARYWDVKLPSAQAKPTFISKVNTAIQLGLVAFSLPAPVFGYVDHQLLHYFWYLTASTTIASGLSYIFTKGTVEILAKKNSLGRFGRRKS